MNKEPMMNDGNESQKTTHYCPLGFLILPPIFLIWSISFFASPVSTLIHAPTSTPTCRPYNDQAVAFTFCDAAHDDLADEYTTPLWDVRTDGFIPPVILKAIGWYESSDSPTGGWTQCVNGVPFDTGGCDWGIMQIHSHMNCDPGTQFNVETQQRVKYDYRYNIAMGAYLLRKWKWDWHQQNGRIIGDGNPYIAEHWYYAVWAYKGWDFANNPNNPLYDQCDFPYNLVHCAYVDRIWATAALPPTRGGRTLWSSVNLTRPNKWFFPRSQGQWNSWTWDIPDPLPVHRDGCRNCLPLVLKAYH